MPTGGSVDVKASSEEWGDKKGYTLKVKGVQENDTRFVREGAQEWNDDDDQGDEAFA